MQSAGQPAPMLTYRAKRDTEHRSVLDTYTILGFISSGTYGRVYKAQLKTPPSTRPTRPGDLPALPPASASPVPTLLKGISPPPAQYYAIKKFKPDKEGEVVTYTGISQSAIREIGLNRELSCARGCRCAPTPAAVGGGKEKATRSAATAEGKRKLGAMADEPEGPPGGPSAIRAWSARKISDEVLALHHYRHARRHLCQNVVALKEVILEDKSIYMVFEYAEHDFLQIIHHHSQTLRQPIPSSTLKSLLHQLLLGTQYLHSAWILHRDLKPANILVTAQGVVKIGDLGLARVSRSPLQALWAGDKVVVTIWYRSPELLLGARHYTAAIDMWAVGCIYAELLALRPIFKGEEAKISAANAAAAGAEHALGSKMLLGGGLGAAVGAGGMTLKNLPFQSDQMGKIVEVLGSPDKEKWPEIVHMPEYSQFLRQERRPSTFAHWFQHRSQSVKGYQLLSKLFEYDPMKRLTAREALEHPFFTSEEPAPNRNAFAGSEQTYPSRRVSHEDNGDAKMGSQPPTIARATLNAANVAAAAAAGNAPSFRPGVTSVGSARGGSLGPGAMSGGTGGLNGVGIDLSGNVRKKTRMGK